MPRKNPELMSFTKVKKKTIEDKRANMEKVRDLVDQYSHIYVFDTNNFRNPLMKKLKKEFEFNGRFFMGKVKPTMIALGKNEHNEYRDNLRFVANALLKVAKGGHKGLFFTNNKPDKINHFFRNYKVTTFAKTGFVATKDYIINKGELNQFVFSQEYVLKRLGIPVVLKNGRLILNQNYILCEKGQPLKPEQCKLLELFNEPMAKFCVNIYGYWTNNEYYECVKMDNEQKCMEQDSELNENKMDNQKDIIQFNNENKKKNDFLDAFVGDDDSSDEDIQDID
eukprot:6087_1